MSRYRHPKWQVEGNFPPGQFGFDTQNEAIRFAEDKRKEGYDVEVSEL